MTPEEVAALLKQIAARDNRRTGPETIAAWLEDLDGLDFDDCREAVRRHFRESTDWLMPAHIRRHVGAIREERFANDGLAVYQALKAADPVTEEDYRIALKSIRQRVGGGQVFGFPAVEAGSGVADGPSKKYQEIRGKREEGRRADALSVARDLDPDELADAPTCGCGALLDPDGSCFTCGTAATA